MRNNKFSIGSDFSLNGESLKIISGAIHYFRIVPEYWRDRLEKLKAMGCNTAEIYVPWNIHEPQKGEYCFDGMADVCTFISLAHELELWVIVRPGPYICAEWEFGGLPAWLLKEEGMRVRSTHQSFMRHVSTYFKELLARLAPLQVDNGGPIIMIQVENEYGYYDDDTRYMNAMKEILLDGGITVPLVTSDGPDGDSLLCGLVDGAHPTANFGTDSKSRLDKLERFLRPLGGGPLMVMEFWVGWFDAWGDDKHAEIDMQINAENLDEILSRGSVNIYMFHGGTNFGFMSGSNYYEELTPDVTSYDYDAPLSEAGDITEKYLVLKQVIGRYADIPDLTFSTRISKQSYGCFDVNERVSLFSTLDRIALPHESGWPLSMEKLDQNYGYILYRSRINKGEVIERIRFVGANDRALIYTDKQHRLTLFDRELLNEHRTDWPLDGELQLDILMENMGRVNYGPHMNYQRKGIAGAVCLNGHQHSGWEHYCLDFNEKQLDDIDYAAGYISGEPSFHRVEFSIDNTADTFLDMDGWGKGCIFINKFNLGRFWEKGPQRTLYIPAPLLKKGENEIIIFETEGKVQDFIKFIESPIL